MSTPGRHRQHDVIACQRPEIVDQRGQVVARLEHHEPASVAEFGGGGGDLVGELAVGERRGFGQHRDPVAVAAQMVDEPAHLEDDSVTDHLDADLGVVRRRVEAVLSHDDRCGVSGGVDREQHVVSQELGGDDGSDAVATLVVMSSVRGAVRNHRRDKLFGPKRQRRGPIVDRRLHGYAAQRALRDAGRDSARQRNAVTKELGGEAVVGLTVDVLRGADLGEAAVPHDRDLVGDRERLLLVVGHQQRRHSGVGE